MELTQDFSLTQHIEQHTRVRGMDHPSLLDLLFTRHENEIEDIEYKSPLGKSDHVVVKWNYIVAYDIIEYDEKYNKQFNFRKGNYKGLKEHFKEIKWEEELNLDNINDQYTKFCDIYKMGVNKFVPYKKLSGIRRKNQWMDGRCMVAREKRDLLWNRFRRHGGERAYNRYKTARNEYTKVRREAEVEYQRDIVDKCEKEPKLFHSFIKSKIKVKDKIQSLADQGKIYSDEEEICELLNKKFQSVFTQEKVFEGEQNITSKKDNIENIEISIKGIEGELKSLDKAKSGGPDEISCWVLKECAHELSKPLYIIMQESLNQGKLPESWKRANIVPLFKKGNRQEPLNYRPVSLTSVVCKIMEKIIRKSWIEYLEKNAMISGKQFGFRKGRSCVSNLLSYYSRITEKLQEREGWIDSIYLDFKKAFDRVPHQRLIWKLQNYGGVQGKLLRWMKDFLEGRKMRTTLRGKFSNWLEVTSGVPQGSVLAPIMFLIYINDIQENTTEGNYMNMFADDAKIQRTVKNKDCCLKLQEDLDKLHKWSEKWQMEFNTEKSHIMNFGRSDRRPIWEYKLGNKILKESMKERDLGVVINKKLTSEDHINGIVKSTYALLANMKIAFTYIDEEMLRKILTSYIRPKLEYAAVVWSPHLKKDIMKLEKVQRAATRWVPTLRELSYEERLEKLNLPKLEERRVRGDMIMMYKCMTDKEQLDVEDLFTRGNTSLRGHSMKLNKRRGDKDVQKYSFPNRTIDLWNSLPEEVVGANSIHKFKEKYDKWLLKDGTLRA